MIDFGEVVIFSGQPEEGQMRVAGVGGLVCESDGCGCFMRSEERSGEHTDLLAGDDDVGSLAELGERGF